MWKGAVAKNYGSNWSAYFKNAQYFDNVATSLSADEITRVYRRRSLKVHPDKNPQNAELASAAFTQLSKYYNLAKRSGFRSSGNYTIPVHIIGITGGGMVIGNVPSSMTIRQLAATISLRSARITAGSGLDLSQGFRMVLWQQLKRVELDAPTDTRIADYAKEGQIDTIHLLPRLGQQGGRWFQTVDNPRKRPLNSNNGPAPNRAAPNNTVNRMEHRTLLKCDRYRALITAVQTGGQWLLQLTALSSEWGQRYEEILLRTLADVARATRTIPSFVTDRQHHYSGYMWQICHPKRGSMQCGAYSVLPVQWAAGNVEQNAVAVGTAVLANMATKVPVFGAWLRRLGAAV